MAFEWWTVSASLLLVLLVAMWRWWRRYATRFSRLGLPYAPPVPLLGNMADAALARRSQHDIVVDLYNRFQPHPYGGIYGFAESMIMIRDPEIIRAITVKDFDHFTDHADFIESEKANPIQQRMLIILKGKDWHDMRTTLSPAFTSMKMKNMFVLMTEIGQQMVDYLWKETAVYKVPSSTNDVLTLEMKEFFTHVTNDVIATSAFGVKVDSLSDPENVFYSMGRELSTIPMMTAIGYKLFPSLMLFLGLPFFSVKAIEYFRSVVSETIETRQKQGIVRPDMLHLLMQARRGELAADEAQKDGATTNNGRRKLHLGSIQW